MLKIFYIVLFFLGFIVPHAKEKNIIMITFSENVVETADWNYVGKLILFATQCSIIIHVSSLAVLWLEFLNISLQSLRRRKIGNGKPHSHAST
jgi:hypothetical protein